MTTPLPTPPLIGAADFETKADAFLGALPVFQTEMDALGAQTTTNAATASAAASSAAAQADLAAASAAAAASGVNALAFVPGQIYTVNQSAISQIDYQTYRHTTPTSALATDPKNDPTNWVQISGISDEDLQAAALYF